MKQILLLLSLLLSTQSFAQQQKENATTSSPMKQKGENNLKKEAKPLETQPITGQQRVEKAKENSVRSLKKEN